MFELENGNNGCEGLFFISFLFFCCLGFWYWVVFKGGAEKWAKGGAVYHKSIGFDFVGDFVMRHPIILKILATIVLSGIALGFLSIIDECSGLNLFLKLKDIIAS